VHEKSPAEVPRRLSSSELAENTPESSSKDSLSNIFEQREVIFLGYFDGKVCIESCWGMMVENRKLPFRSVSFDDLDDSLLPLSAAEPAYVLCSLQYEVPYRLSTGTGNSK
jgi:hypothetical protein